MYCVQFVPDFRLASGQRLALNLAAGRDVVTLDLPEDFNNNLYMNSA